jgi:hypothetical protein
MLAACIEAHQDMPVEAPAFLLVGDTTGALSILPVRSDAQFLTDAWKPQLKVRTVIALSLSLSLSLSRVAMKSHPTPAILICPGKGIPQR